MDDFEALDAVACADLVRRGEVKPLELVEAAIDRIESRDPALNSVVTKAFDRARLLANEVDVSAPLAGVPFLIKDQLDWEGVRTTHGSRFLLDDVATDTSEVVRRWLRAGVVPLGKTNVPECGLLATTEPLAHGPTGNPWDTTRTTGGSSGGSAASVAAGLVTAASASDGGGSIRIPASSCGLFGLKSTRGRTPGSSGWGGLSTVHVVTRSVRDSAAFLDAACGPSQGDMMVLAHPEQPFLANLARDPRRLRIAVTDQAWEGVRYAPEVAAAVRRTADLLSDLGHEVVEGRPSLTPGDIADVMPALSRIVPVAIARSLDAWSERMGRPLDPDLFEPLTWSFAEEGRAVAATDLLLSFEAQARLAALVQPFFVEHDMWLLPTVAEIPPHNGEWQFPARAPRSGWLRMLMFVPPLSTALANFTGQPAMSVPLDQDEASGMPIGSQLYGRWGDEATLLQLAAQLERARPWADRRPPVPS